MPYELKRLQPESVEAALAKADRYRALNQPEEAESICRDILEVAPDHQAGIRMLGLALTDRFPEAWTRVFDEALATFGKLKSEYERVYYAGVSWERCAKAQLEKNQAHNAAHSFEQALVLFEKAGTLAPPNTPDPVLRWNRCVRALQLHPELVVAMSDPRLPPVLGD